MYVSRAVEIIDSSSEFLVLYNQVPVWLQSVNEEAETARVYTAANPDKEMEVPVAKLLEA
ncbi:H-type small acid-soluble spore protein [Bacillus marinisedimentorum]|uniref:H-type small acid-soluble spore protein n=1 Tax=Bacillus marinisedimentorum TaxID=1821260 RepID=UPI0007E1462F|nr:H-type small acid-soluble spore protein [Bacillus marinisedimentorum]